MSKREDGRLDHELRPVIITRGFTENPAGSVLIEFGHQGPVHRQRHRRGAPVA